MQTHPAGMGWSSLGGRNGSAGMGMSQEPVGLGESEAHVEAPELPAHPCPDSAPCPGADRYLGWMELSQVVGSLWVLPLLPEGRWELWDVLGTARGLGMELELGWEPGWTAWKILPVGFAGSPDRGRDENVDSMVQKDNII